MAKEKNTFRQVKDEKAIQSRMLAYATVAKKMQEAKKQGKQNRRKSTSCQGKGGDFRMKILPDLGQPRMYSLVVGQMANLTICPQL